MIQMGIHTGAGSSGLKPRCHLLTHYLARLYHLPSTPLFFLQTFGYTQAHNLPSGETQRNSMIMLNPCPWLGPTP